VFKNNVKCYNLSQEGDTMKEAKHSLKLTIFVLYAVLSALSACALQAGEKVYPGDMPRRGERFTSATGDTLNPGEMLRRGEQLTSGNRQYRLILQQDGNLVLYGARKEPLWTSNTQGQRVEKCIMQPDGNLVLYLHSGQPAWASNTNGRPGSFLVLQNDGNLVIYQPQPVWASNTAR
jgi:hypothetical protein